MECSVVVIVIAWAVILLLCRYGDVLNAMLLGESEARHLGINVQAVKVKVILLTALAVGVSVSVAGVIGFVGLVVPHLIRLMVGPNHKVLFTCFCHAWRCVAAGGRYNRTGHCQSGGIAHWYCYSPDGGTVLYFYAVAATQEDCLMTLDVQHATVTMGDKALLNDVSLRVQSGQVITVLGPNGAGQEHLAESGQW